MNTIRESIKQKMLAAHPDKVIDVTVPEFNYVFCNPGVMQEICKEVETVVDNMKRAETTDKCCDQTEAPKPLTFEEAAKPLMSYLAEHFDSDETIALVGPGGAELVTTVRSIFRD